MQIVAHSKSNIWLFYDIARESHDEMLHFESIHVEPMPNKMEGKIIRLDPERRSFKAATKAIVFCGIYLEALFHLLIADKFGKSHAEKVDRKNYTEKLTILGITDQKIHETCKRLSTVRREIVHEKVHLDSGHYYSAQSEARKFVTLIVDINKILNVARPRSGLWTTKYPIN